MNSCSGTVGRGVASHTLGLILGVPKISGLNPVIGKILSTNCTFKKEKIKIKKKRPGMAHLKKRMNSCFVAL